MPIKSQSVYLQLLNDRVPVVFDGALGTEIGKHTLNPDDFAGFARCNEMLSITRPDIIRSIHKKYLEAGARVIETNTMGANRYKLAEFGLEDRVEEINRVAAIVAREAVESYTTGEPGLVCASLGPTGYLPSSNTKDLQSLSFDDCVAAYEQQSIGLLEGGVDIMLMETMNDLLEVRACIVGIRKAFSRLGKEVPIQVQVTMDQSGHTLLGSSVLAFLGSVVNLEPTVIGLNCSTGPYEMKPMIQEILAQCPIPVSMIPNAGMPENRDGCAFYSMDPDNFSRLLVPMVEECGVSVVGGCCGTSMQHIRALSTALQGKRVALVKRPTKCFFLGTGIGGKSFSSLEPPRIIGERLNAQGSKQTKQHLLADNLDELYQIALEQERLGCAAIDICVAVNEKDNERDSMVRLIRFLSDRVSVPFCIDSTSHLVIEAAVKNVPGSVLINSINLENDGKNAARVCALAHEFGCGVVALPITDEGMAKKVDQKIVCAERLVGIVCSEYGIPEEHLFFDPLVFTLATGDPESADAVAHSLETIRIVKKKFPGINTIMGVSNASFGLQPKARRILNNLLLHHAKIAGLDAAIFNPLHLDSIETYPTHIRKHGEALLFNTHKQALAEFAGLFQENTSLSNKKKEVTDKSTPEQKIKNAILLRDRRELVSSVELALRSISPQIILDTVLIPAMAEVGDKMAKGEMILPFVLQSAEIMQQALHILEPYFSDKAKKEKGTIILATVFGDVHDIGKNLVGTILRSQGYRIVDLGKQVPCEAIVQAVEKEKPDAVGLSALLVATSKQMENCVNEFHKRGIVTPIIIGGAAVDRTFASRIAKINNETDYPGGVFYARDAFEAIQILNGIKNGSSFAKQPNKETFSFSKEEKKLPSAEPSPLKYDSVYIPPFYGASQVLVWETSDLLNSIDCNRLFKSYWKAGNLDSEKFEKIKQEDFSFYFERLKDLILKENLVEARGIYGYYPVFSDDTVLFILDPYDFKTEIAQMSFPRIVRKNGRSFADYFRPEGDIIAIQVVTIGGAIDQVCSRYFESEEKYADGFLLYELGNYLTEEIADRVSNEIRRGLGISDNQGRCFAFGYEAVPDIHYNASIFSILGVEDRIGITLTSAFQMVPEHSTAGLFASHLDASY